MKNLTQQNHCDFWKVVAMTFAEGGCDMRNAVVKTRRNSAAKATKYLRRRSIGAVER